MKYEEVNTKRAATSDMPVITLLTGDSKIDMKEKLHKLAEEIQNPFKHIRNWVKGEMMELGCLLEAIGQKEGVESHKLKAMSKLKEDR